MFIETGFTFDGYSNSTHNLKIVDVESTGMKPRTFGVSRNINKDKTRNNYRVIKTGTEEEVLTFQVTMALDHPTLATRQWTTANRMAIAKWLFVDDYKEFKSADDMNVVYRCIPINAENFINGLNEGYATLEFECDSAYVYRTWETISLNIGSTKVVNCTSNITHKYKYYPKMYFSYTGSSASITITNTTNGDVFSLTDMTGLPSSEWINVYGDRKQILTANGMNVFNKWNKGWVSLDEGDNTISVTGTNITFAYFDVQYPIML